MNCNTIENIFIAYMDGKATAAERREVEEHLHDCAACRARAEEFRGVWNALDEVPQIEPSFGFDARLRQRVAAEPRPKRWSWLVPSPRLAFSLAMLAGLSFYLSTRPPAINPANATVQSEQDFKMIKDLGVLENYDVLSNFDAVSELPPAQSQQPPAQTEPPPSEN
ncbi:MAG: anti-sigma factor family protein [Candidatus Acidiferrales bacterium]